MSPLSSAIAPHKRAGMGHLSRCRRVFRRCLHGEAVRCELRRATTASWHAQRLWSLLCNLARPEATPSFEFTPRGASPLGVIVLLAIVCAYLSLVCDSAVLSPGVGFDMWANEGSARYAVNGCWRAALSGVVAELIAIAMLVGYVEIRCTGVLAPVVRQLPPRHVGALTRPSGALKS